MHLGVLSLVAEHPHPAFTACLRHGVRVRDGDAPSIRFTALNSSTAFLGSVVIGNGVNFGIILLARYREERAKGHGVEDALVIAIRETRMATAVAATAAAASYGSLLLTQFQGFRQFGVIGGIGMLFCLGIGLILLSPALVAWFDKAPAGAHRDLVEESAWAPGCRRSSRVTHAGCCSRRGCSGCCLRLSRWRISTVLLSRTFRAFVAAISGYPSRANATGASHGLAARALPDPLLGYFD